MLLRKDAWVTAGELYDGDVVTHPRSGETVTIAVMMQMSPLLMISVPGVVEFDPEDNQGSDDLFDNGVDELELAPADRVFRLWQYAPDSRV